MDTANRNEYERNRNFSAPANSRIITARNEHEHEHDRTCNECQDRIIEQQCASTSSSSTWNQNEHAEQLCNNRFSTRSSSKRPSNPTDESLSQGSDGDDDPHSSDDGKGNPWSGSNLTGDPSKCTETAWRVHEQGHVTHCSHKRGGSHPWNSPELERRRGPAPPVPMEAPRDASPGGKERQDFHNFVAPRGERLQGAQQGKVLRRNHAGLLCQPKVQDLSA
mmetsp:Transcript_24039/g.56727  ORF Transcript_24039/g.56727 Transcript_24039/m.56727 type:complete len:221 (+) Transcript_24039:625-1287(+)